VLLRVNSQSLGFRLLGMTQLASSPKCFTDIDILRRRVEGDQPIAVWAVQLEAIANPATSLAEERTALGALDLDLLFKHWRRPAFSFCR
jgi:hypothetical protein